MPSAPSWTADSAACASTATDSTLQLGRARFALTQSFAEIWSAHLDASVWDDKDAHLLGATEAYLQLRPYPRAGYRLRVKAGAFYPPVSLENRASGWESPYTLSYSAINSWLATEVRTIGAEAQLEWLGTRLGHAFDLGVTGAVFGWNDQAGVVLANDGFLLHDRQTPLFGRVGQPDVPPLNGAQAVPRTRRARRRLRRTRGALPGPPGAAGAALRQPRRPDPDRQRLRRHRLGHPLHQRRRAPGNPGRLDLRSRRGSTATP